LQKLYKNWEEDPNIGFVMMKGSGRAFCAGGDIVSLYHLRTRGTGKFCIHCDYLISWRLVRFVNEKGSFIHEDEMAWEGVC
jgi:1,4-dihydroxy-2-naphthoyl-CoA synthase